MATNKAPERDTPLSRLAHAATLGVPDHVKAMLLRDVSSLATFRDNALNVMDRLVRASEERRTDTPALNRARAMLLAAPSPPSPGD